MANEDSGRADLGSAAWEPPSSPGLGRVAAIVPAYNERETLAAVLQALRDTPVIDEILVVSDGSTDETALVARRMGVRTLELKRNHGKGVALATGVIHTSAPVLLFVDGDILNLSPGLFVALLTPVLRGEVGMNVGIRHRGRLVNAVHRRVGPLLSGIRCLRREIFEAVPDEYLEGFRIETALNWVCCRLGHRTGTLVLHQLRHRVKEEKQGLVEGVRARLAMFASVLVAHWKLRLTSPVLRSTPSALLTRLDPESPD